MNAIIHVTFLATGEARIGNRLYRWDFDDYCGPTFVRADGEPLKRQPGPRHKVWKAFGEWLDVKPSPGWRPMAIYAFNAADVFIVELKRMEGK